MASGVAAIFLIGRSVLVNLEAWTLTQADGASIQKQLASLGKVSGSADYFEALAELAVQPKTQDFDAAQVAAKAAVQADPSRAHVWALLAYLESQKSGITSATLVALTRSMAACPLCDQDLIRWRFNFVLANWGFMPEEIRWQAFEQADILRWTGENDEFLAEMRMKALGAGIPFDDYRRAVNTPVRTLNIGFAPEPKINGSVQPDP